MGIRINQNIMAMNSYRNLTTSEGQLSKSLERLSSGYRINKAADDASGLVISEGLRSQVMGLKMAIRNTQDGVSVVQTAEGALTEVHSLLQRIRELSVQALSTGSSDEDARAAAQAEVSQLIDEVDRIATTTRFGGQNLLNGSYGIPTAVVAGDEGDNFIAAVPTTIDEGTSTNLAALLGMTFIGGDENFTLVVDGVAQNIEFTNALDDYVGLGYTTAAELQDHLQAKIDGVIGAGVVEVTLDNSAPANPEFGLVRESTANGTSIQVIDGTGVVANQFFNTGANPGDTVTATVDPAQAGDAGFFATSGGTATVVGNTVSGDLSDYSGANNGQSFKVTVNDIEYEVELTTDLSGTANPATTLRNTLNNALSTAILVSDGVTVVDISGDVEADVVYADETGQIQVELRTTDTGPGAALEVTSMDGGSDVNGADDALFNTLFGSATGTVLEASGKPGGVFQVGADGGETIEVNIRDLQVNAIGIDLDENGVVDSLADSVSAINIETDADQALDIIDAAIQQVSAQRGELGAIQNRFEHTIANLSVTVENLAASESRIRDTDMAEEMMAFTRAQILQQAGTSMLAQANAVPQSVLQLLQ